MNEAYNKVALKQILVGNIRDNYDLWSTDKLSFHELLRRVRGQARAKKFDTDVAKGKAGVTVGRQQPNGSHNHQGEELPRFGTNEHTTTDVSAFQKCKTTKFNKGKCKGKGDHKGK